MRTLVLSLVIFIIMLGFSWWVLDKYIEPVTTYFSESCDTLSDTIDVEDWEKAQKDMKKYYDKWEADKKLWIYLINQRDIDGLESSFKRIEVFITNKDKNLAQAELEHLKILFNVIIENERLSLENIL